MRRWSGATAPCIVQDLGSSGGTFVNGNPAKSAELHQGDVVTFATVRARFEAAPSVSAETQAMPTQAAPPPARATRCPRTGAGSRWAGRRERSARRTGRRTPGRCGTRSASRKRK